MDENRQVDPKTLNKFMSWQAFAGVMMWMLCVGAATAPDTSSRTSVVLAAGATIYMIITLGSSFWTGYSREYKRTSPPDPVAQFMTGKGMLSLGSTLFLLNFTTDYFTKGESLASALLGALFLGGSVAGVLYLLLVKRKARG